MRPDAEGFWLQAERNLARAQNDFAAGFYDGTVANSQQAAELALKALITELAGSAPPMTHSLARLEAIARTHGVAFPASVGTAISGLPEGLWTQARYPDAALNYVPARDITEQQARDTARDAEVIVKWVQQQLIPPPPPTTR
jgi:HEPN domain-containing protein